MGNDDSAQRRTYHRVDGADAAFSGLFARCRDPFAGHTQDAKQPRTLNVRIGCKSRAKPGSDRAAPLPFCQAWEAMAAFQKWAGDHGAGFLCCGKQPLMKRLCGGMCTGGKVSIGAGIRIDRDTLTSAGCDGMSPPCAPTPGTRSGMSLATSRTARIRSGWVAPTTRPICPRDRFAACFGNPQPQWLAVWQRLKLLQLGSFVCRAQHKRQPIAVIKKAKGNRSPGTETP